MTKRLIAACTTALVLIGVTISSASAHASLTRCSIKNGQVFTVANEPHKITAFFAEPLDIKQSWIAVFEGQADHGLVTEKQHTLFNYKNPQEMMLNLPKMGKEKYYMIWYTHSAADGHYAAGIVYFQVK